MALSRWTIGVSIWSFPIQIFAMFLMAIISYKFIEQPIRNIPKGFKNWQIILVGLSLSIFSSLGISSLFNPLRSKKLLVSKPNELLFTKGRNSVHSYIGPYTKRLKRNCSIPASSISQQKIKDSLGNCYWEGEKDEKENPLVVFYGDSHGLQLFPIAEKIAEEYNYPVLNIATYGSGCLVPYEKKKIKTYCQNVNMVPNIIDKLFDRSIIFVIASIADPILHFPSNNSQFQRVNLLKSTFQQFLESKNNYLIVVKPNPKFLDMEKSIKFEVCMEGNLSKFNPECKKEFTFNANEQKNQRKIYIEELDKWKDENPRIETIDHFEVLCTNRNGMCSSKDEFGKDKYWDKSHLFDFAVLKTYPLYKKTLQKLKNVHQTSKHFRNT